MVWLRRAARARKFHLRSRQHLLSEAFDKFWKRTQHLMLGSHDIFCQYSVNNRNICSIGFLRRSIPSERRSCDSLPSKQAVMKPYSIFYPFIVFAIILSDRSDPIRNCYGRESAIFREGASKVREGTCDKRLPKVCLSFFMRPCFKWQTPCMDDE